MFWGIDMVGPNLEEALIGTDHRLHLELEGVLYLESLIPHLIEGVARHFMISLPAVTLDVSSSYTHQVCLVPLSVCLCSY